MIDIQMFQEFLIYVYDQSLLEKVSDTLEFVL